MHSTSTSTSTSTRPPPPPPTDCPSPLADSAPSATSTPPADTTSTTTTAAAVIPDQPSLDVSFLQDPTAYHVLPTTAPAPFINAPTAPSVSSPIDSLLASGHYRLAAIAAARNIVTAASPSDYSTLFHLVHIRLACLCLINQHALAAQESKVLGDLNSAFYRHPFTNAHLVPWPLRLLVVRLAALGYGEWRKGIMGYYELARECRESILKAPDAPTKATWRARLRDTGIRVANTLVEMGDIAGAGAHLATLPHPADAAADTRELLVMETLVWLRIGDMASARRCLALASTTPDALTDGVLSALLRLADADYDGAAALLRELHVQFPADAMVAQNLGVCLLYTGRIAEARSMLGALVDAGPAFYSAVFNLSTVFELCSERNRDMKMGVAEMLAARRGGDGVGWERTGVEFKL